MQPRTGQKLATKFRLPTHGLATTLPLTTADHSLTNVTSSGLRRSEDDFRHGRSIDGFRYGRLSHVLRTTRLLPTVVCRRLTAGARRHFGTRQTTGIVRCRRRFAPSLLTGRGRRGKTEGPGVRKGDMFGAEALGLPQHPPENLKPFANGAVTRQN